MIRYRCVIFFLLFNSLFADEISKIHHVPANKIIKTVNSNIKKARKSIVIASEMINSPSKNAEQGIMKLMNSISLAHIDGLKVQLITNPQYLLFYENNDQKKNYAMEWLKSANVPVYQTAIDQMIHYNLIIIDESVVIESSVPLISDVNFDLNQHSVTLIESKDLAKEKVQMLKKLKLKSLNKNQVQKIKEFHYFSCSEAILNRKNVRLFLKNDPHLFYLYINLNFYKFRKKSGKFKVSLNGLRAKVFNKTLTKIEGKKRIFNDLSRLKKHKLIDFSRDEHDNVLIEMIDDKESDKIKIPLNYYIHDIYRDHTARMNCVYLFLLNQMTFHSNVPVLKVDEEFENKMKKNDLSLDVLNDFERLNFIEIMPTRSHMNDESNLMYRFLDPIPSSLISKHFQLLNQKWGVKEVNKASFLLSEIHQERNPSKVSDVLFYIKEVGFLEVQKVFNQVSEYPKGNLERSFVHIKKILTLKMHEKLVNEAIIK